MSVSPDSSLSRISPAVAAGRWALALPKRGVLLAIALYQRTLSPVWPAVFGPNCGCRFYPTCSHYAAQAVGRHGALVGSWLALVRVLKCTPLHPGGVDEVPPKPLRRPSCARVAS